MAFILTKDTFTWSNLCIRYLSTELFELLRIRIRNRLFNECTVNALIIWSHTYKTHLVRNKIVCHSDVAGAAHTVAGKTFPEFQECTTVSGKRPIVCIHPNINPSLRFIIIIKEIYKFIYSYLSKAIHAIFCICFTSCVATRANVLVIQVFGNSRKLCIITDGFEM